MAARPSAIARCVLPTAGGPNSSTFSAWARKCPAASSRTSLPSMESWNLKSNSSRVFTTGKCAILIPIVIRRFCLASSSSRRRPSRKSRYVGSLRPRRRARRPGGPPPSAGAAATAGPRRARARARSRCTSEYGGVVVERAAVRLERHADDAVRGGHATQPLEVRRVDDTAVRLIATRVWRHRGSCSRRSKRLRNCTLDRARSRPPRAVPARRVIVHSAGSKD